jgi:hypothetical protein
MNRIPEGLHWLAVTAWVGALWTVGLMVAPTLFHYLPDRTLFGSIVARLFTYTAFLGIGCGTYLVLFRLVRFGSQALKHAFFWLSLAMLVLTIVGEFAVHPVLQSLRAEELPKQIMETVVRERFATWHGVANVLYLIECVLGAGLVLLQARAPH